MSIYCSAEFRYPITQSIKHLIIIKAFLSFISYRFFSKFNPNSFCFMVILLGVITKFL